MNPLENIDTQCPWCGENIELLIECIEPQQEYTEDCPVCCAPMVVSVNVTPDGVPEVSLEREGG